MMNKNLAVHGITNTAVYPEDILFSCGAYQPQVNNADSSVQGALIAALHVQRDQRKCYQAAFQR